MKQPQVSDADTERDISTRKTCTQRSLYYCVQTPGLACVPSQYVSGGKQRHWLGYVSDLQGATQVQWGQDNTEMYLDSKDENTVGSSDIKIIKEILKCEWKWQLHIGQNKNATVEKDHLFLSPSLLLSSILTPPLKTQKNI